ncbi:MAG: A/G-specific adenine glycosylase [Anaerolineales bacterium]
MSPFPSALLSWYAQNAREMPWRGHPSPYAVWVSEIMLQQTRVETVIPYFERWMARLPTVEALATAGLQEVLNLWEGLGYYSRARNLHRTAKIVVGEHGGQLPRDVSALRKLPGIGPYTAGAIASIAFGLDEPLVDGNVRRVLARVFDVAVPADSTAGKRRLWELAAEHLPPGRAGDYNQALMDLGAMICTPRNPACVRCPVNCLCEAHRLGSREDRPVLKPKTATPHYIVTAAVIRRNGQVLIAQRPENGLLGGLWEFPGGKLEPGEDLVACLQREIREELGAVVDVGGSLGTYKHAYTHFRVTLHAFGCTLASGEPRPIEVADLRWVTPAKLPDFPMGKIDRQIARRLLSEEHDG